VRAHGSQLVSVKAASLAGTLASKKLERRPQPVEKTWLTCSRRQPFSRQRRLVTRAESTVGSDRAVALARRPPAR